jgi:hypothetical protein
MDSRQTTAPSLAQGSVLLGFGEGELLGDVLLNGLSTTDSGYYVFLETRNDETDSRLVIWSGGMWVSPAKHNGRNFMFEWIDPRADGACGNLTAYLAGDTTARSNELHWASATSPPVIRKERHCIRPGQYRLYLSRNAAGEDPIKVVEFDYVPLRGSPYSALPVTNTSAGTTDNVEELDYDATSYAWSDVFIHFDVGNPGGTDAATLYAENEGGDPYLTIFTDQPGLGGTPFDYFRFSSRASTSSTSGFGRLLSRLWWDGSFASDRSGFYDSHSQTTGLIRTHQFTNVQVSVTRVVGLETMRPSEQPASAASVTRAVAITVPQPPPPPFQNDISGPELLQPTAPTLYTWWQSPSGGIQPYSLDSWFKYVLPGPEILVGSGFKHKRTVAPTTVWYILRLRAVATDASPQTDDASWFVEVGPPAGGGAAPLTAQGVRLEDGRCGPRPSPGRQRQAWLHWVFTARAARVEFCLP